MAELLTDSGLANTQLIRSGADTLVPGYCFEGADAGQQWAMFDHPSHIR
jgi:hypothetical protein